MNVRDTHIIMANHAGEGAPLKRQVTNVTGTTHWRRGVLAGALALGVLAAPLPAMAMATPPATTPDASLDTVIRMIDDGQFHAAEARIQKRLAQDSLSADEKRAWRFQRERMRRMRMDFSLTADDVKERVRRRIPDLSDAEFARWDAHGLFEHMVIDGERRYFRRSPSNLFRLSAEARKRRAKQTPFHASFLESADDYHRQIIRAALGSDQSSVLPQHVKVTQSVTVDADAVPSGKTLRAWIPYPRAIKGQQEDIHFDTSDPAEHRIAPESTMQRTVYLEKTAEAGKPTVFSVTYDLDLYAQYHAIDADEVVPAKITPALKPYVSERPPHIVFSQPLEVFSKQIVGDATNPYRIAQRIYAAVDDTPWAGAREYSTVSHLGTYAMHAGHGDCGQQTMLLITLMRMNGIPARWQSGWTFTRGDYNDIHDWAEIYLEPYGWVPVDVTYGRLDSADPAVKWFYLGGLDNFRIAFNDDFGQPFVPAKQSFRSDTVDSQRGEVEWEGGNLYYDQWSYHFEWTIQAPKRQEKKPAGD